MTLALIRAEIRTIMLTIAGMGQVYDYMPFALQDQKRRFFFRKTSGSTERLHFWAVQVANRREEHLSNREVVRQYDMFLHGFYALENDGASGPIFDDEAELVCTTFRSKDIVRLNGQAEFTTPLQIVTEEEDKFRTFMNVLCHHEHITFMVQERLSLSI